MRPMIDMHCDLLLYLASAPSRSVMHPEVRCSLPQLRAGNIKLQTMAIFTETEKGSTQKGQDQLAHFMQLPQKYPNDFQIFKKGDPLEACLKGDPIQMLLAVENASGFFEEDESIENGFERIENAEKENGKILYITVTWNLENRFGGGAHTSIGLKEDGRHLLDFLDKRKIAVDLSHASDSLAHGILDYIDKKGLHIPVVASHSNFRAVSNVPRNLPDELALEILRRKGIIGFVLYRAFIGEDDPYNIVRQMEHMIRLGGAKQSCFGADFFSGTDLPPAFQKPLDRLFFPDFGDASDYGNVMNLWQKHLGLSSEMLNDIAHHNFLHFYKENISFN
jgi:membrane dipeptidase